MSWWKKYLTERGKEQEEEEWSGANKKGRAKGFYERKGYKKRVFSEKGRRIGERESGDGNTMVGERGTRKERLKGRLTQF